MKRLLTIAAVVLWAGIACAQSNFKYKGLSYTSTGVTFANLTVTPPQLNGTSVYCTDCQITNNVCSGGGGGADARLIAGQWQCFTSGFSGTGGLSLGNYSGQVNITGTQTNGADQISHVNVNQVLNALTFSGADIGAKINAAIVALPTKTITTVNNGSQSYHYGTVYIPNTGSVQTFAAMISLPATVSLVCDRGTQLQFTGAAPGDMINALDPNGLAQANRAGGIFGCTVLGPSVAAANQNFVHFGNFQGFQLVDDVFENGQAGGQTASGTTGVLMENTTYFTEDYVIRNTEILYNNHGVVAKKNCGANPNCTNSFEHGKLDYYCADAFASAGDCLDAINGANLQFENLNLNFNLVGASNSSAVSVDSTSVFEHNTGNATGENQTGGNGFLLTVAVGGFGEWANVNSLCSSCTSQSAPQLNGRTIDVPLGAEFSGAVASNTFVLPIFTPTEIGGAYSIQCQNVTGGTCTTAPSVSLKDGSTVVGTVACPNTIGAASTSLASVFFPLDQLAVVVTTGGTSCTAPTFGVIAQLREN